MSQFQQASVIGTIVEVANTKVVVFKSGEHTMIVLPAYKGSAESVGASLTDGTLVRLSGQVTSAGISKVGTAYIKMNAWHVLRLGTSDAAYESPAELLPGDASIVLLGNLGRDPELRFTPNEKPVCNFSVAAGDPAVWFRVTAWGRQGENCKEYLFKGSRVLVAGRVDVPTPFRGNDGNMRANLSVTAIPFGVVFLSAPKQQAAPQARSEEDPWA